MDVKIGTLFIAFTVSLFTPAISGLAASDASIDALIQLQALADTQAAQKILEPSDATTTDAEFARHTDVLLQNLHARFSADCESRELESPKPGCRVLSDTLDADSHHDSTGYTTPETPEYQITFTPSTYDFGIVPQGSSSTQTFTISNTGSNDVTLTPGYPYASSLLNPEPFTDHDSTCGSRLAAGQSCTVQVTFEPHQAGNASGYLFVRVSEATTLFFVSLRGSDGDTTSYVLALAPSTYDFGLVPQGSSSTQAFTISNVGSSTVHLTAGYPFASSLLNPEPFIDHDVTCGTVLAPGQSCTVLVTFEPHQAGNASGYLFVRVNEATTLFSARLIGSSGDAANYALALAPAPYNFGIVALGLSRTQTFTISNSGSSAVTLATGYPFASSLLNPEPFTHRNSTCGSRLQPGQFCTVQVTFEPHQVGIASGYLFARVNEATTLFFTSISGTGANQEMPIFSNGFD